MYDKGADKCSYFKHNEDMVVCTLQFIAQHLISYKVESVIEQKWMLPPSLGHKKLTRFLLSSPKDL